MTINGKNLKVGVEGAYRNTHTGATATVTRRAGSNGLWYRLSSWPPSIDDAFTYLKVFNQRFEEAPLPKAKVGDVITWGGRVVDYRVDAINNDHYELTAVGWHNPLTTRPMENDKKKLNLRFGSVDRDYHFQIVAPYDDLAATRHLRTPQPADLKRGLVLRTVNQARTSFTTIELLEDPGLASRRLLCKLQRDDETPVVQRCYVSALLSGRYGIDEEASKSDRSFAIPPSVGAPTRDFNRIALDYKRPKHGDGRPVHDMPEKPTLLIREADVLRFLKMPTSTIIYISGGTPFQAKSVAAKRHVLLNAKAGELMMLAVPGMYSQDIFFIDNRNEALQALGLKPLVEQPTSIVKAADGSMWEMAS